MSSLFDELAHPGTNVPDDARGVPQRSPAAPLDHGPGAPAQREAIVSRVRPGAPL